MTRRIIGDRYEIIGDEPIAVQWNPTLAELFPYADHHGCRQSMHYSDDDGWRAFDPPICHGYHCLRCGAACGPMGHQTCTY